MQVFIIGVNGFIGSNLLKRILETTDWEVYGMDLYDHYIQKFKNHERFHFHQGDLYKENNYIEEHIKKCDVVIPLVAIAQPKRYVQNPLEVFSLDFEENLKTIRWAHEYDKRIIFPSTSEVYGMCTDKHFDEETSNLVYGPINKVRWIYACSKQLLDRLIYAYGRDRGLRYTLFRPFNWVGPNLDTLESARKGNCRAITQFIANLIDGKPIELVGGGTQKRAFTDIDDGIDALMCILKNDRISDQEIFNIGNPNNIYSIEELAEMTLSYFAKVKGCSVKDLPQTKIVSEDHYYGKEKGFQDVDHRVPNVQKGKDLLGWAPTISLEESIRKTVDSFLQTK